MKPIYALRAVSFAVAVSALFFSTPLVQTRATAPQDTVIVKMCNESNETSDLDNLPPNCRWSIEYRGRNGGVWGAEVGSTMSEVIRKKNETIAKQRKMDETYGGNTAASYENSSPPICTTCVANLTTTDREKVNTAILAYREIVAKIRGGRDKLVLDDVISRIEGIDIQIKWPGGVLKDYARALTDANQKLKGLMNHMLYIERTGRGVINIIDHMNTAIAAAQAIDTAWAALPSNVRNAINGVGVAVKKPPRVVVKTPSGLVNCDKEAPPPHGRWSMLGCYHLCCSLGGSAYEQCQKKEQVFNDILHRCAPGTGKDVN